MKVIYLIFDGDNNQEISNRDIICTSIGLECFDGMGFKDIVVRIVLVWIP